MAAKVEKLVCIICGHASGGSAAGIEDFETHMAEEHGVDL